jgi:peptidoglycan hydrolase CwlO-like protein
MAEINLRSDQDGLGRVWLILIIIVSVIIVGCIGYGIGKNQAESSAKKAYDQKVESLQKELDEAKQDVSSDVENGQEAVKSLQEEKNRLEEQVAEQQKKIDQLEDQLSAETPPPTEPKPEGAQPQN